jgi:heptose I phosphotransferase
LVLQSGTQRLAVYLKRHYALARWRGLLAVICPDVGLSPALEEWRHLEWARDQGLLVPSAVAAGEYLNPWGRLQSFLAVQELTGMIPLHEAIPAARARLDSRQFQTWKRTLVPELARIARVLHDCRRFHKDLYLCHFYIPAVDEAETPPVWHGQVHLIDLHRLRRHRWTWPFWLVKDLAQLLYSSEIVGVDARDRLRFWRAYMGAGRRTSLTRLLRQAIGFKWRRYRQHNLRTKARRALAQDRKGQAA